MRERCLGGCWSYLRVVWVRQVDGRDGRDEEDGFEGADGVVGRR